ncbi:hypothetical protein K4L44_04565 [Halosquirtibacter laminarini]|uniref:Uncharacterized protein n=1 Tax=Halosquirtibacter laminarini TaxID=3374600 RepID=A0AC61NNS7_9BACT|nr:hypothetical protein K4L44_04565 [Prolixibacteraceae bacterium]
MKNILNIAILLLLCITFSCSKTTYQDNLSSLKSHKQKNIEIRYSNSYTESQIQEVATRMKQAITFYGENIQPVTQSISVLVLNKDDWKKETQTLYGMPYAIPSKNKVVMTLDNNDFWKSTIPNQSKLTPEQNNELHLIYDNANKEVDMSKFFSLLVVHELGHVLSAADHVQITPNSFNELFANLFLHCYVATKEPKLLETLEYAPSLNETLLYDANAYTTLKELDANYSSIAGVNYAWYQNKLHVISKKFYNDKKIDGLKKFVAAFRNANSTLKTSEAIALTEKKIDSSLATLLKNF